MEPVNQVVSKNAVGPMNVLLIEADPMDAILIRKRLGEVAQNFQIRHVRDGLEAFDYFHNKQMIESNPRPDLIVLDEDLPNINGHQVLNELKSNPKLQDIPIVMILKNKTSPESRISLRLVANQALANTNETPLSPFLYVIQNLFKNK